MVAITVPEGATKGAMLNINYKGQSVQVTVPEDGMTGQKINVPIPIPIPPKPLAPQPAPIDVVSEPVPSDPLGADTTGGAPPGEITDKCAVHDLAGGDPRKMNLPGGFALSCSCESGVGGGSASRLPGQKRGKGSRATTRRRLPPRWRRRRIQASGG